MRDSSNNRIRDWTATEEAWFAKILTRMWYIGKENDIRDSDDINQFWMRDSHQKKKERSGNAGSGMPLSRLQRIHSAGLLASENVKCNTICHVFYPLRKVLCDCVTSQKQSTKFNCKKSFNGLQCRLEIIKNWLLYYNFLKTKKITASNAKSYALY